MTTCVVEVTVLIPEFPGGCGGESGMLEREGEGEGGREERRGGLWVGFFLGEKEKEEEEEKKGGQKKRKEREKRDKKTTHIN